MQPFIYQTHPQRIVFRPGALAALGEEVDTLGARKVLVLCTPAPRDLAARAAAVLGARCAGICDGAVMHVPVEQARLARSTAAELGADCVVAIGGGSTIGLGKAIALESALPIVAVPTTYAGSEMTPIYGLTEGGIKKTGRDRKVLPRTVIYDPMLTLTLPAKIAGPSGMNAIAHCVEALYAENANPVITLLAAEGIRALSRSLPVVVNEPGNVKARSDALYGAWLAGSVLGNVGMAIHHKLCHTLGGTFNLPHAENHTAVLPHAVAFNREAAPEAMRIAAEALSARDAAQGIYDLAARLG